MKIRHGFVSNSSSSNFILAFDKKPKSAKELRRWMFGDQKEFAYNPYGNEHTTATTEEIANAVFNQLDKPLTLDEILHEFTCGWLDGVHIDDWNDSNVPEMWIKDKNGKDVYNPAYDEYADAKAEKENIRALEYFNNWKCPDDQMFFCVSFGDDDGPFGGLCEHGGIFDNIHHVQISHH